ncbi:MAG: hypothetical protein LQ340_005168 [Diploschistes diacapsis]|nr:MAG: hypothetical protein LQ340_005168 [Diploschistes diacapsis]
MAVYMQQSDLTYDPEVDFELIITENIWGSILESAVGLIACNLPIVYGLFRTTGFRSFASGLRYRLSGQQRLTSIPHYGPRAQASSRAPVDPVPGNRPKDSTMHMTTNATGSIYTEDRAVEIEERQAQPMELQIMVTRSVDVSELPANLPERGIWT